jgi:hypothetical protein
MPPGRLAQSTAFHAYIRALPEGQPVLTVELDRVEKHGCVDTTRTITGRSGGAMRIGGRNERRAECNPVE